MATGTLEKCAPTDESWFQLQLYRADGVYGVVWASSLLMSTLWRVPHGGSRVMVWAGISYREWTQLHFINGNLNAQWYRDNVPVLPCPAYSDISPIEHVWDALDWRVQQRFPVPANIQQLCTAIEEWDNTPQSTAWSTLCEGGGDVTLHEVNGGHTGYWLVLIHAPALFFKKVSVTKGICIPSHVKSID